jgi:integrase
MCRGGREPGSRRVAPVFLGGHLRRGVVALPQDLRMPSSRRSQPRRKAVSHHPGIYCRPRPDGKVMPPYEIRYFDSHGRQRWETIYASLREAEARRAELRLRRWRGQRAEADELFRDYARAWLDRQEGRPRTLEGYRWALDCHVIPYFGDRGLGDITADHVAAFIAAKRGAGLKSWTISTMLRPLSMLLRQAARRGHIPVNPMSQLERRERPRHDDARRKRILTLPEMRSLLEHTNSATYRALFALLLTGGLRIGEALGLTSANLDREHAQIRVEYQLGRDGIRAPLKTEESRRSIDLPLDVMDELAELVDASTRRSSGSLDSFVFASRTGRALERKVVRAALRRASRAADLAKPYPTLHDLRHSHASMMIALGVPVVEVQHRLGHRTPDTTLRVYAHEWRRTEAERSQVGRRINQLLGEESPS